jgi:hypothetical protein
MPGRTRFTSAGAALLTALVLGGCGGGGGEEEAADRAAAADGEVRRAATTYLEALRGREWDRACELMTADARRQVERAVGGACTDALAAGGVLPAEALRNIARELRSARVRVRGDTATIGPLGALPQPLRLRRQGDRWLVAGA